jgi:hypothetical protein
VVLDDPALSPSERTITGSKLLADLAMGQRWADLKSVCLKILTLDLPPMNGFNLKELAYFDLYTAEEALNERDLALKTGDEFLTRYPTSSYAQPVQMKMKAALDGRQREAEAQQEGAQSLEPELAKLAGEHEHDRAEAAGSPERLAMIDSQYAFGQCQKLWTHRAAQRAIDACEAFGRRGAAAVPPPLRDLPPTALFIAAQAHAQLREFKAARDILSELERDEPAFAKRFNFEAFRNLWRTE